MFKKFFVYVNWTREVIPRPFYVGKGDSSRVTFLKRNRKHKNISSKYGNNRIVSLETFDESFAFEIEVQLIEEQKTFYLDSRVGCNFTRGGEGPTGRISSLDTHKKISLSKKGKTPKKIWSDIERSNTSKRMSLLHRGKRLSKHHKMAFCQPKFGETNGLSLLTTEVVQEIRLEWSILNPKKWSPESAEFFRRWSSRLEVDKCTVRNVVSGASWKHLIKAQVGSEN